MLEIANRLIASGDGCRFNLLGQQFSKISDEMNRVTDLLRSHGRLQQVDFIESDVIYRTYLKETQIVLSTSR